MKVLKRIPLYFGVAAGTLTVGLYISLAVTNDPGYFWRPVSAAQVTINGHSITEAKVYRQSNGMLLMDLGDNIGWQLYRPDFQNIYWCNRIKHISIPGYIYAKDCDSNFCPCVGMGTVKTEVDADLNVQPNYIEFNSRARERIRVSW